MKFNPGSYYFNYKTAAARQRLATIYANDISADACQARQLIELNRSWRVSLASSPWARGLKQRFDLPDQFNDWNAFTSAVPVLDKPLLRQVVTSGTSGAGNVTWRATGGTTSEPFRFPIFRHENVEARNNMAWFRHKFGVAGGASVFLLWGHSHLLGAGVTGVLNRLGRGISDALMGYHRFSAYDLSDAAMGAAGDAMARFKPDCMIGYTRAIERFVRVNRHRQADFNHLKLVQPTGEGYSSDETRLEVAEFFRAPVKMEYGTVETGPIAYQGDSGFRPLWLSHHLEILPDQSLAVTSLYPRALPLLRYRVGDLCEAENPNLTLNRITGRVNDFVELAGKRVHSELISHAVRDVQAITGYQLVVDSSGTITLKLTAPDGLSDEQRLGIHERLIRVEPALKDIQLQWANELIVSPSGKRPMVVRL